MNRVMRKCANSFFSLQLFHLHILYSSPGERVSKRQEERKNERVAKGETFTEQEKISILYKVPCYSQRL